MRITTHKLIAAYLLIIPIVLANVLTGCGSKEKSEEEPVVENTPSQETVATQNSVTSRQGKIRKIKLNADAGVPVEIAKGAALPSEVYHATVPREDPFEILPGELIYKKAGQSAQIFGQIGGFEPVKDVPKPVPKPQPVFESQPRRSYLGLMIGRQIVAFIKMENGQVYSMQQGQKIPSSDWTVHYIDPGKVILRRYGKKLPKEVTLMLEGGQGQTGNVSSNSNNSRYSKGNIFTGSNNETEFNFE